MAKTYCFDKNYFMIAIFTIILILYIIASYYIQNQCISIIPDTDTSLILNNKIKTIEQKIENYESNKTPVNIIQYPTAIPNRDPKEMNSLDRIYNPLKYPYKSDYFYDQSWYPNLELPFQVIGSGYRTMPSLGSTQIPIYNGVPAINISNENIAPINISTRGPIGKPQQLGILYKINGNDNDFIPLFGRKKYPNDNKYEYYTMIGNNFAVKVPVLTKNRNDELGNNDVVFIKGRTSPYRVTIYETDSAEYIPYL
jgi:hypothetical protein